MRGGANGLPAIARDRPGSLHRRRIRAASMHAAAPLGMRRGQISSTPVAGSILLAPSSARSSRGCCAHARPAPADACRMRHVAWRADAEPRRALLLVDDEAARSLVERCATRGIPAETHLSRPAGAGGPPAGRCSGTTTSATSPTSRSALVRLQHVLRGARRRPSSAGASDARRRARSAILLMPLPGEQHTFGLSMLADFFRRAGWNVWSGAGGAARTWPRWSARNGSTWSASPSASDDRLDEVAAGNPHGPARLAQPRRRRHGRRPAVPGATRTCAAQVGADATARTARTRSLQAERLLVTQDAAATAA